MRIVVDELESAIARDEIVPYFQPVVDLRNQRLTGFETLARWAHPTRGMVAPGDFIREAEQCDLIGPLTESLLRQACETAQHWPSHLRLSVNISTLQLKDRGFARKLCTVVEAGGFSMNRLTIEITESALLGDISGAREVVRSLKDMGSLLAIDDFGTGYSSLNHLRALPFDVLKVDASFVRSMVTAREDRKIVAAVVGLGHSLGMTPVAEGIEEREQADMLLCLGCHLGQGWLYAKAMPAEAATAYIHETSVLTQATLPSQQIATDVALQLQARPADRLAQLQALYDGAPVGLCFLDLGLRYVSLNHRLAEINNVPVEAHVGRPVAEVTPHVFDVVLPKLREALGGRSVSFEIQMNGRSLLTHYQPARDEAGEIVGVSVAVIDIRNLGRIADSRREA